MLLVVTLISQNNENRLFYKNKNKWSNTKKTKQDEKNIINYSFAYQYWSKPF